MITNILSYLENSADQFPDKTAFSEIEKNCSFSELNQGSVLCGAGLIMEGILPRTPVPVLMEKGVDAIQIMMGVVRAGAFYVMLDVAQPAYRLKQILDTLEADVMVSTAEYQEKIQEIGFVGRVLWAEKLIGQYADAAAVSEELKMELVNRRENSKNTDPLYGIFTSGSTGVPKGVVVSHRSTIDFIDYFTEIFGIDSEDVLGNQAPWDFDVSVKDIYSGLRTGAEVAVIPRKLFSIPMQLLDYLEEKKVTNLTWAVSALCMIPMFHGFDYKVPQNVKRIMFSGEAMPVRYLNEWRHYVPDAMYVNLYGPTEITCNCTYHILDREYEKGDSLPIGKSFPNETVFLLDDRDELVTKPGEQGEICVTGTCLALGYYRNPEQTARAFVQNPLNKAYPEIMYRTGDLGYYDEEGLLYFTSRKDFQIKHMGHRIELGEIETAMERVEEVRRGCCFFDTVKNRIIAVYTGDIEKAALKRQMGEWLPAFMLPNRFVQVEEMPLTKNGKIDRTLLKDTYCRK